MMNNYVLNKIAHMRRLGLVAKNKSGFGKHGGACPDWLAADQKKEQELVDEKRLRRVMSNISWINEQDKD